MLLKTGLVTLIAGLAFLPCSWSCYGGHMIRSGGLSCYDKQIIVDEHNRLRQQVALGQISGQPSAANMLEMTWDEELARRAQSWANRCIFQHEQGRAVARFSVGQNMASSWSSPGPGSLGSSPDFGTQIRNWFNEVYSSPSSGHYSQIVWGDTHLVGCGYAYYMESNKHTKLYVCNYGPAGNIAGVAAYRRGTPACTQHGTSPSRRYHGLCEVYGYNTNPCYYYG